MSCEKWIKIHTTKELTILYIKVAHTFLRIFIFFFSMIWNSEELCRRRLAYGLLSFNRNQREL